MKVSLYNCVEGNIDPSAYRNASLSVAVPVREDGSSVLFRSNMAHCPCMAKQRIRLNFYQGLYTCNLR